MLAHSVLICAAMQTCQDALFALYVTLVSVKGRESAALEQARARLFVWVLDVSNTLQHLL